MQYVWQVQWHFTPFTPVGTLIGNTITIEAKAAEAVDTFLV
ncbi:MAG: hypothetical protein ACLVIY_12385 [Anaerobutyricum soehngenii]